MSELLTTEEPRAAYSVATDHATAQLALEIAPSIALPHRYPPLRASDTPDFNLQYQNANGRLYQGDSKKMSAPHSRVISW